MAKYSVFSVVDPFNYHASIFESFRRLSRDGLVPKDSDRAFGILGDKYIKFVESTGGMPDYQDILDWVPTLNS